MTSKHQAQSKGTIVLLQGALCAVAVVCWELAARGSERTFFLVGSPSAVAQELAALVVHGRLGYHFAYTGAEAALGLVIGTVIGGAGGLCLWFSDTTARVVRPFLLAAGSFPVFALAPLMIVWFGIGFWMKVAMATFATVFLAFAQSYKGAATVDGMYVASLQTMNATRPQVFRKVIVPGAIDWVLHSMRLNVGLALLGAFIGEFIASDRGLGHLILRAAGLYNVPRAIAAAIGIVVLALLLERFGAFVESRRHTIVQLLSVPRLLWRQ